MCRSIAAVLFAGCLTFQMWAQTQAQTPATQPAPTNPAPASAQAPAEQAKPSGTEAAKTAQAEEPKQPLVRHSGTPWDQFQEFSAIMVGGPLPGNEDPAHIYRFKNLIRAEGRESKNYLITDTSKTETHGLAPGGCIKYKLPYTRTFPFSVFGPESSYESVPVGEETAEGHKCRVEDVTIYSPKRPMPFKVRLWEAEDLQGFPVRIEVQAGLKHQKMHYENVVLGPQDPTLFIVPNQCQNFDINSAKKIPLSPNTKKAPEPTDKPK